MRLVHVTDLHYARGNAFQQALISALLGDAKALYDAGFLPDFLIFSGDLVNDPDEPEIYEDFEARFLMPLLDALRLTPREVILCPGNHDISRRAVKAWSDERKKLIDAMALGQNHLDQHLKLEPTKAYIRAASTGFLDLTSRCGHAWNNPLVHHYSFPNKKASFVALNSGYACGLEGSPFDRGKLAISANEVLGAFQQAPEGHRVLSLMHHTISDLAESSARLLGPILARQSAMHLFGHVHQPYPTVVFSSSSSCFMIQGGALYERDGQYNGYSFVAASDGASHIAAKYRTYYTDRQEFDVGTNVAPDGSFYNAPAAKSYWETLVPAPANDDVCLWLLETADIAAKELDITITGKSLRDTFVEPAITKQSHADETANTNQRFTVDDVMKSRDHTVLCCPSEHGATSLLSFIAMRFHSDCLNLPKAVVPVFLDGRRIRAAYEAAIASTLRAALPESDQRQFKLGPLHDNGRLVILIDDIDPTNNQHINYLSALRQYYPRARLIVAVKLDLLNTDRLRPVIGIDKFDLIRVGTLSRGKVRMLVEKWHLPAGYQTDAVVDEIHSRFQALGIPQTAAYVAIYLSVLEGIEGYNPINSSTVIETFVEAALQKYKPQYIFRSSFDYRNQIDYLGFISEQMSRKNVFVVPYEEVYAWTKEHFESIGVEHDYSKLIRHFIDNKVFADEGNDLYFRYKIFLSFFIAHRMQQSGDFLSWMLTDFRFTNFISEFDIYCGLSRRDAATLEFLGDEFAKLSAILEKEVESLTLTDRLEKLSIAARRTDTYQIGRPHMTFDAEIQMNVLTWRPQKTARSSGKVLSIPVLPFLQEALDAMPKSKTKDGKEVALTFLTNDYGRSFASAAAFGNKFADWCDDAELKPVLCADGRTRNFRAHGLRKAALYTLYKLGATNAQLQSIGGHSSLAELQKYIQEVEQDEQAIAAMALVAEVQKVQIRNRQ